MFFGEILDRENGTFRVCFAVTTPRTFRPEMINETYQHTTADYAKLAFI